MSNKKNNKTSKETQKQEDGMRITTGEDNSSGEAPVKPSHQRMANEDIPTKPHGAKNIIIKTAGLAKNTIIGNQIEDPYLHPIFIYEK